MKMKDSDEHSQLSTESPFALTES
ncbi:fructose-1,6-bisphosphatase [Moritella sp. PE36]|nr:fructose-1,6-bisphosphatase [Moritella sp. PE36]